MKAAIQAPSSSSVGYACRHSSLAGRPLAARTSKAVQVHRTTGEAPCRSALASRCSALCLCVHENWGRPGCTLQRTAAASSRRRQPPPPPLIPLLVLLQA